MYSASPLAIGDFRRFRSHPCSPHQALEFYRGPLRGLQVLHGAGIMHRDVHIGNLLITSIDPPEAVLCDFGKSIEAQSDTNQFLGPISTRAPEIDGVSPYNEKIDIWSLGFSYCEIAFPGLQSELDRTKPIDRAWHIRMTACFKQRGKESLKDSLCSDLLLKILAWNPADRVSAAEALRHPYFSSNPAPSGTSPEGLHHKSRPAQQLSPSQSGRYAPARDPPAKTGPAPQIHPYQPTPNAPAPIQNLPHTPHSQPYPPTTHIPTPRQDTQYNPRRHPVPPPNAQQSHRHAYLPARPAPAAPVRPTGYGPHAVDRLASSDTPPRSSSSEEPMGASMLAWHRERQRQRDAATNTTALLHPPMKRR